MSNAGICMMAYYYEIIPHHFIVLKSTSQLGKDPSISSMNCEFFHATFMVCQVAKNVHIMMFNGPVPKHKIVLLVMMRHQIWMMTLCQNVGELMVSLGISAPI